MGNITKAGGGPRALAKERMRLARDLTGRFRAHFQKHGIAAIERLYEESPAAYLKIAVMLLPKTVDVEVRPEASYQDALQQLSAEMHANTGLMLHNVAKAAEEAVADAERGELNEGHYPQMESEPDDLLL